MRGPISDSGGLKLFGVGFHKTGTSSLHAWCTASGLKSRHWPAVVRGVDYEARCRKVLADPVAIVDRLMPVIDAFDAHCDVPYSGLYKELSRRFPDAYFVLTTRDLDPWWDSLSEHWSLWAWPRAMDPFEYVQYRPYLGNDKRLVFSWDANRFKDAHARHVEEVKRHFAGHHRFVTIDIAAPGKSEILAGLTGLTPVEFPVANLRAPRRERVGERFRRLTGLGWTGRRRWVGKSRGRNPVAGQ